MTSPSQGHTTINKGKFTLHEEGNLPNNGQHDISQFKATSFIGKDIFVSGENLEGISLTNKMVENMKGDLTAALNSNFKFKELLYTIDPIINGVNFEIHGTHMFSPKNKEKIIDNKEKI